MRAFCLSLLACVALAFAPLGCGDDDDNGGDGDDVVSQPEPASPIDEQMALVNQAISEQDCEQFAMLNFSFVRAPVDGLPPEPGAPATSEECKFLEDNPLSQLAGVEFTESAEFGAAAITEGETDGPIQGYDHVTMIWLTDWDGEYRNLYYFPADPQLTEEPAAGIDPASSVQALIDAARTGDCKNAEEFIEPTGLLAQQNGSSVEGCEAVAGGEIFAPAVKATPDAAPEEMGIVRDYAFYGVPTADAYFGVTLATPPVDPGEPAAAESRVIDVVPLTEVELEPAPEEGG
jgi:hypothetical protein